MGHWLLLFLLQFPTPMEMAVVAQLGH